MTVPQAFTLAVQHHQAGRLADAEAVYRQILTVQPNHAGALHLLGVIAYQAGRHEAARDLIRQSISIDPNNSAAHSNLGEVCRAMGMFDEAMVACRRALELQPGLANAHLNIGNAHRDRDEYEEAVAAYHRAIKLKPDYAEAYYYLGVALRERGRLDEAVVAYRCAIELKSDLPEAHFHLGIALRDLGRLDEAVVAYRHALRLKPDYPVAHNNLGAALAELGRWADAIAAYRHALELKPDYAEAHYNLGAALREQGELDEAVAAYRRAINLKPRFPEALNNLGATLAEQGQFDEAIVAYRHALSAQSDYAEAHNNLGNALREQGQLDDAVAAYRHAIECNPHSAGMHSNLVYTLHFHPGHDDKMVTDERQRWSQKFSEPLKQLARSHANDRSPERRLRVGYVSPDFRDHVVGRNLLPLFHCHDRRDFEILCYSGVVRPDKMTDEFHRHAHQWRGTVGVGDEALADMIRQDGVDILVDLTQHLAGNRLPVFARKPAPVQVSFAGYPDSAGLEAIEYRISDRYLETNSADDITRGTEHVCLIESFWCYDPCGMEMEIHALPALESGAVTFGSLGNFSKVNDPVLKLWARVLGAAPHSRLAIWSPEGGRRERTLETLRNEGVEAGRVEFVKLRPRREYLELYHRLDIVLDTAPYNGHTTSLDALWMGVPVVSLAGKTPVSRAGLSQLSNLGLPELVAHSEAEYVNIAANLARDVPRLAELRSTLRQRMETSVLMDAPRFARQIEQAYRKVWQTWRGSHPNPPE